MTYFDVCRFVRSSFLGLKETINDGNLEISRTAFVTFETTCTILEKKDKNIVKWAGTDKRKRTHFSLIVGIFTQNTQALSSSALI